MIDHVFIIVNIYAFNHAGNDVAAIRLREISMLEDDLEVYKNKFDEKEAFSI